MRGAGLGLDAARTVRAQTGVVRTALTRALRDAGFEISSEHTTLVQARRGSQLAGTVSKDKLPVQVTLTLTPTDPGCRVAVRIEHRWRTPIGRVSGVQGQYRLVFADVLAGLDRVLTLLDPQAVPQAVADASVITGQGAVGSQPPVKGMLERANNSITGAASSLVNATDRQLRGGRDQTPEAWQAVRAVRLVLGEDTETLSDGEIEAVLGVAALISAQPGPLPARLGGQVERLAAVIEPALASGVPVPTATLMADDRPALVFLRQQAALRESLPVRRLLVCRDCRFEKVVNDDYQRLADRNRKLSAIVGGLGATIRPGSVSPFVVVGQLFRLKNLMPDFVCPRCQGMECDPHAITFCPSCGKRHEEAALRSCSCGFDFRAEGAKQLAARPPVEVPDYGAAPALHPESVAPPSPPLQIPHPSPSPAGQPAAPAIQVPRPSPAPGTAVNVPGGITVPPAGWHPDPWRRARLRWWDGRAWTGHTAS